MGTRADFYIGTGQSAEWLGSIAMDGYPDNPGHPMKLVGVETQGRYREVVEEILSSVSHSTTPDQGWPWPWDDSSVTDYAYCWDGSRVVIASDDELEEDDEPEPFPRIPFMLPNQSHRRNVALDERSGLVIFGV